TPLPPTLAPSSSVDLAPRAVARPRDRLRARTGRRACVQRLRASGRSSSSARDARLERLSARPGARLSLTARPCAEIIGRGGREGWRERRGNSASGRIALPDRKPSRSPRRRARDDPEASEAEASPIRLAPSRYDTALRNPALAPANPRGYNPPDLHY